MHQVSSFNGLLIEGYNFFAFLDLAWLCSYMLLLSEIQTNTDGGQDYIPSFISLVCSLSSCSHQIQIQYTCRIILTCNFTRHGWKISHGAHHCLQYVFLGLNNPQSQGACTQVKPACSPDSLPHTCLNPGLWFPGTRSWLVLSAFHAKEARATAHDSSWAGLSCNPVSQLGTYRAWNVSSFLGLPVSVDCFIFFLPVVNNTEPNNSWQAFLTLWKLLMSPWRFGKQWSTFWKSFLSLANHRLV